MFRPKFLCGSLSGVSKIVIYGPARQPLDFVSCHCHFCFCIGNLCRIIFSKPQASKILCHLTGIFSTCRESFAASAVAFFNEFYTKDYRAVVYSKKTSITFLFLNSRKLRLVCLHLFLERSSLKIVLLFHISLQPNWTRSWVWGKTVPTRRGRFDNAP